jgi:hypothetical protein
MQANSNFFDFDSDEVANPPASVLHLGKMLSGIAAQLEECAATQDEVAQVVSRMISGEYRVSNEDIVRLQAIDKTIQLLNDISAILNLCSRDTKVKSEIISEDFLAVLKLAEVRRKLMSL